MQMKLELGDDRAISNCNIHLADIYAAMMEHEKATALFETALLQKEQLEEPDGIIRCYLGLGSVRLVHGTTTEEAGRFADLALEKARQINAREYLASASRIKADLAVKQGDYRSAYQYLSQYHLYQDSLMDDATAIMAMEMELRNSSRYAATGK
jgi:tetratricopeptide (TPR) repeat protein